MKEPWAAGILPAVEGGHPAARRPERRWKLGAGLSIARVIRRARCSGFTAGKMPDATIAMASSGSSEPVFHLSMPMVSSQIAS